MPPLAPWQRYLQLVIYGSIGQSLIATMLAVSGVIHLDPNLIGFSYLGAIASLGLSIAFGVPLLPATLRRGPRGLRDHLWNSRMGTWLARRMNAPVAGTIFRPTEVAIGVAAGARASLTRG